MAARLSHDSSPSVRVAAMRAMTQQSFVDLSDRIDQMARTDPSPTVCQLAQFYLTARVRRRDGVRTSPDGLAASRRRAARVVIALAYGSRLSGPSSLLYPPLLAIARARRIK